MNRYKLRQHLITCALVIISVLIGVVCAIATAEFLISLT